MSVGFRAMTIAVAFAAATACSGAKPAPMGGKGPHSKIRINFKKEGSDCKLRTVPKNHEVLLDEEDALVWSIKDNVDCLRDHDLVIKWAPDYGTSVGPSTCSIISTAGTGNTKKEMKCALDPGAKGKYTYKLYLRNISGETEIADPDVEIVMF